MADVDPPRRRRAPTKARPVLTDYSAPRNRESTILRNLGTYIALGRKSLESKICEAGPGGQRLAPHILGAELNAMAERGEIRQVLFDKPDGLDAFALNDTPDALLAARKAQIVKLQSDFLTLLQDKTVFGDQGEEIVKRAFRASSNWRIVTDRWGDVEEYDGIELPTHPDGVVLSRSPLPAGVSADEAMAAIEIKNRRAWIYPSNSAI